MKFPALLQVKKVSQNTGGYMCYTQLHPLVFLTSEAM